MDNKLSGDYVYVVSDVLEVFDVSDPAACVKVGSVPISAAGRKLVLAGNYGYIASGNNGVRIFNINTPEQPEEIGSFDIGIDVTELGVKGNYLYAAEKTLLHIIDVSNPIDPHYVTSYGLGAGPPNNIVVEENYLLLAHGSRGLTVLDVSIPDEPIMVASFPTQGNLMDLAVAGQYIYAADVQSGFFIFRFTSAEILTIADSVDGSVDFSLTSASHTTPHDVQAEISFTIGGGGGDTRCGSDGPFGMSPELGLPVFVSLCEWAQNESDVRAELTPSGELSVPLLTEVYRSSEGFVVSAVIETTLDDPAGMYCIVFEDEDRRFTTTCVFIEEPAGPRLYWNSNEATIMLRNFQPNEEVLLLAYDIPPATLEGKGTLVGWKEYQVDSEGALIVTLLTQSVDIYAAVGSSSGYAISLHRRFNAEYYLPLCLGCFE